MEDVTIKLTADQAEQFKKEGKITIEMPKEKERTVSGWFVDMDCDVLEAEDFTFGKVNDNIYATKEQAEASIAQARLTQEMKLVNGDWVADWNHFGAAKYCILFEKEKPQIGLFTDLRYFLCFKDSPTAEKFLSDHYDLIMAYKPLA